MTVKSYRILKILINFKIIFLLLFLISVFCTSTYAQVRESESNENVINIKTIDTDYNNYYLYANINISLHIEANNEFSYLILPIKKNSGLNVYYEPDCSKRTILYGFLEQTEYIVFQFSPSEQTETIEIFIDDIQLSIDKYPREEVFGYYRLEFCKAKESIPKFIGKLIKVDKILIEDKHLLSSSPDAMQRGIHIIEYSDDGQDISIYISKDKTVSISVYILIGLLYLLDILCSRYRNDIKTLVKENEKRKWLFVIIEIGIICIEGHFFITEIFPNRLYEDITCFAACFFGVFAAIWFAGIIIIYAFHKPLVGPEQIPERVAEHAPEKGTERAAENAPGQIPRRDAEAPEHEP